MKASSAVKSTIKSCLAKLGVQITLTRRHDWSDTAKFIPLEATLKGAREAGMSVGDYIDTVMNNIPGATQAVIDGMKGLGVFANPIHTVVEIGPGSGRYLEKTQRECSPERYEFYETAAPWAAYVEKTYAAIRQPTDGLKLAATADASADLVQAHKVFSGINLRPTLAYWREMARITRSGGFAVFDIVTEECLSPELISRWIDSGFVGAYPAAVPRLACTQYFQSQGFRLVGSFLGRMGPGTTETFVFRKNG